MSSLMGVARDRPKGRFYAIVPPASRTDRPAFPLRKGTTMSIVTGAVTLILLAAGARAGERRPVPLYTNDDLARIAAGRGDAESTPAPTAPPPRPARAEAPDETKTEAYWRARARRL